MIVKIVYFIEKIEIISLNYKNIIILTKYFNLIDIFLPSFIIELLEYIGIKNYVINLGINKYLFYNLIYSLEPIKLKILKT